MTLPPSEQQALTALLTLLTQVKQLDLMAGKIVLAMLREGKTSSQLAQQVLDLDAAAAALPINNTLAALAHREFPGGMPFFAREKWIANQREERRRRQRHVRAQRS